MTKKKYPTTMEWTDDWGVVEREADGLKTQIFNLEECFFNAKIHRDRLGKFLVAAINDVGYDNIIKGRIKP